MEEERFVSEVRAMERTLYRVARGYLRTWDECADAVQEALCKAWDKRKRVDESYFQPWLEIAFVHALSLVPCLAQRFLHRIRALVPGAQISPRHPVQRALHGADLADKTFFLHSG